MGKKFNSVLLSLGMLLGTFTMASQASAATDDITGNGLETEMRAMIAAHVMNGYSEGVYRPYEHVTRGQFATFVSRALDLPTGSAHFTDVSESSPLATGIDKAASAGIVYGLTDGRFLPNNEITREQMAAMIDRALGFLKITKQTASTQFTDVNQINQSFRAAVSNNVYYKIIQGFKNSDGSFRFGPKEQATRAQAAAFMYRMLQVKDEFSKPAPTPTPTPAPVDYQIASIDANGQLVVNPTKYTTFEDAQAVLTSSPSQVIVQGDKIVEMKDGIVTANIALTMENTNVNDIIKIAGNAEMKYLNTNANQVEVQIADTIGWVNKSEVTLIPTQMLDGRSYYIAQNGVLTHFIYNHANKIYSSYDYGAAPSFLQPGQKYYSWNGDTFFNEAGTKIGVAYQYFNVLSLRTKTNYTADELNSYVATHFPDSPLKDLGATMKQAEAQYHVNALYILAKAALESNWGRSSKAKDLNNLFGIHVYDSDPTSGKDFASLQDCIMYFAQYVSEKYLTPGAPYYHGIIGGDKHWGVNVKYASDPFSEQKVSGIMYRVDKALGQKDWNQNYQIADVANLDPNYSLRARPDASTNNTEYYLYPGNGYPMTLIGQPVTAADGSTWYEIVSDSPLHDVAYVNGDYVHMLQIAGR